MYFLVDMKCLFFEILCNIQAYSVKTSHDVTQISEAVFISTCCLSNHFTLLYVPHYPSSYERSFLLQHNTLTRLKILHKTKPTKIAWIRLTLVGQTFFKQGVAMEFVTSI